LDATANVPGTFSYSPAAGTVPASGTQTISVTLSFLPQARLFPGRLSLQPSAIWLSILLDRI
jgi:hypothetical protein